MCKFTLTLALCPCPQNRASTSERNCVRKNNPYEILVSDGDLGYRHVLDLQDGIGLASEETCEPWKHLYGEDAEPSMFCGHLEWAFEVREANSGLVRKKPCRSCLKGCVQARRQWLLSLDVGDPDKLKRASPKTD
jgi:hypothetical protein